MKKLIAILIVFLPLISYSQNSAVDKLFDKYNEKEGFVTVYVSSGLFNLMANMESDDPEIQKLSKQINTIKILALEDENEMSGINFYDEIFSQLNANDYEELVVVKSKETNMKLLVKQSSNFIDELLLVVGGEDNALIYIDGKIDMKSLSRMGDVIDMEEMKYFSQIEEK